MKLWGRLIQLVGVIAIGLSIRGFFLLIDGVRRVLMHSAEISARGAPLFQQVSLTMTGIDAVLLLLMILAGIAMLRPSRTTVKFYSALYAMVILYVFLPGMLWGPGAFGTSVAAASGATGLGIAPLILYPAPFLYAILSVAIANVAIRKIEKPVKSRRPARVV